LVFDGVNDVRIMDCHIENSSSTSWKLDMTNTSLLSFHLTTTSDSKCAATPLFSFTAFTHSCGSL